MLQFLHNHPHVTQVSLYLDSDNAGMVDIDQLEQAIREDSQLSQRVTLLSTNWMMICAYKRFAFSFIFSLVGLV